MTRTRDVAARYAWPLITAGILAYLSLRVWLIPGAADLTFAFTHDSGYLARVAENVREGRGLVIDALWLVFLMPPSVPMPYHNANPLFPLLAAGVSAATGADAVRSGFIVSTFASGILLLALVSLANRVVRHLGWALLIAIAVSLFPGILMDSLAYLTDGLCTALTVAACAILVRRRSSSLDSLAVGALLGLAWLTRSATILVAPALGVYLLQRYRSRVAVRRFIEIALAALIVSSPWLIHTKQQWGSYFRSDSEYSVVQNLAADKFHGGSLFRFWHSPQPPPSMVDFIRESPTGFAKHVARGSIKVVRRTLAWWTLGSVPIAIFMAACFALFCLHRRRFLSAEAAGLFLFAATTIGLLAVRGDSFEERYIGTLTVFFALFCALGAWRAWRLALLAPTNTARGIVVAAIAIVWALIIPWRAWETYRHAYEPNPSSIAYRAASRDVDERFARGTPVVVGMEPYFYTLETKRVALNFPDASDEFLLQFMEKYGARYIFLTRTELDFWRPAWGSPSGLPQGLRLAGTAGDGYVFVASGIARP